MRNERRRRLLADEVANQSDQPVCRVWSEDAPPAQKTEHYGDAKFLDRQPRLLDLIPRRWIIVVILLAAAGIVVGLEVAYSWMMERAAGGGKIIAALDIGAKGSLACWFSTMTLLAASVAAMIVYGIRRHRTDDYQGKYRIWPWAAACLLFMATDQAASLREAFRDLMMAATGTPLAGDGSLWWIAGYVILWGAIGSRVLLDMRPSRLSIGALSAAAVAFTLLIFDRMGWLFADGGAREVMFRTGCEMTGNLMLLAAMSHHARYVRLDAEGLLPLKERPAKEEKKENQAEASDAESTDKPVILSSNDGRWLKIDPPHETPKPAVQHAAPTVAAAPATVSHTSASVSISTADQDSSAQHKLTKAERKAMKERLLRERRERERRG
jgi:hypothetical protein